MMNKRKGMLVGLGIVIVLIIGLLAAIVGNVGIRRSQVNDSVVMRALEPINPCVPKTVYWRANPGVEDRSVTLHLRLTAVDKDLATAQLSSGSTTVVFPGVAKDREGSLNLIDSATGELLAWTEVQLLPPGPDCVQ